MNTPDSRTSQVNNRLTPDQQAAWRAFLSVASQALDQIDQALQKQSDMTLTDYEILLTLADAEERRLRMSELADRVLVSRSRLTYRVDRLTEVGFVTREECEDDRRGLWAILTDKGGSALDEATPQHHVEIHRLLFTNLAEDDVVSFRSVLRSMSDRLDDARTRR